MYNKYYRLTEIHHQQGDSCQTVRNLRHARPRLLECRYELALRRGVPRPSEHPILTSDILLHLQLVQHHLQTLPDTTQKQGTKNGGVAYISREFS
jgi:hypothetical protein